MPAQGLGQIAAAVLAACFAPAQPVEILGWTKAAMEPFLSRAGGELFFNSSNAPSEQTDVYWAKRLDDLHFRFSGPVPGANSSALDGVVSLSSEGTFVLISPRTYRESHATVWIGRWTGGGVVGLEPQPALAPPGPGGFNMDAEISADGRRLYFTENRWNPAGPPSTSILRLARRTKTGWRPDPSADLWFASVNDPRALQYAPALSADELELFFARAEKQALGVGVPALFVAVRKRADEPFGAPSAIAAAKDFAEGPTVSPQGDLYFHTRRDGRFAIMRSSRACGRTGPSR